MILIFHGNYSEVECIYLICIFIASHFLGGNFSGNNKWSSLSLMVTLN